MFWIYQLSVAFFPCFPFTAYQFSFLFVHTSPCLSKAPDGPTLNTPSYYTVGASFISVLPALRLILQPFIQRSMLASLHCSATLFLLLFVHLLLCLTIYPSFHSSFTISCRELVYSLLPPFFTQFSSCYISQAFLLSISSSPISTFIHLLFLLSLRSIVPLSSISLSLRFFDFLFCIPSTLFLSVHAFRFSPLLIASLFFALVIEITIFALFSRHVSNCLHWWTVESW